MFRQLAKEDGIVFVTILMIIMIMMTVTIGIISLNVSQVQFSESEVRRLKSEMMAHGVMAYVFANQLTASAAPTLTVSRPLDGITYTVNATVTDNDSGPTGADPLLIQVTY